MAAGREKVDSRTLFVGTVSHVVRFSNKIAFVDSIRSLLSKRWVNVSYLFYLHEYFQIIELRRRNRERSLLHRSDENLETTMGNSRSRGIIYVHEDGFVDERVCFNFIIITRFEFVTER